MLFRILKVRIGIAALTADKLERLGEPSILVLNFHIGAATKRHRGGERRDDAAGIGSKLHHGSPGSPRPGRMRRFVFSTWRRSYFSETRRFRRQLLHAGRRYRSAHEFWGKTTL